MAQAYIILFHKDIPQLLRLIQSIYKKKNTYVIHVCKNVLAPINAALIKQFDCYNNILFCEREYGNWGEFGIVQATLNAMVLLENNKIIYSHISLLSAQDFPIKKINHFEYLLQKNKDFSYLKWWDFYEQKETKEILHTHSSWGATINTQKLRITRYYIKYNKNKERLVLPPRSNKGYLEFNTLNKIKHFVKSIFIKKYKFENNFLQFIYSFKRDFPRKIPFVKVYGGSQWFTLNYKHVAYILAYVKNNETTISFFKESMLPDESFFQTILLNSPYQKELVNDNLRLIEMQANHPLIYKKDDFEYLLNQQQFFARKFDLNEDPEIFNLIEKNILDV